jgi:short-subunit dehydrogenase
MNTTKAIIITGASSGIGKALATEYAAPGITLFLCGRDFKKLMLVEKDCQNLGATVYSTQLDLTDRAKTTEWINDCFSKANIDLIIANAGISLNSSNIEEFENSTRKLFDVNVNGTLNSVLPAITHFIAQNYGQIAIMSSLAGYRGMPSCPAYSASKGAMKLYAEGLRGDLAQYNIKVSSICPGFVKTPLTDLNNFKMPFIMSPQKAAKIIIKSLSKNKSRIAFPCPLVFITWLLSCIPPVISDKIYALMPKKS